MVLHCEIFLFFIQLRFLDPEKKALHTIILTKKEGDDKEVLAEYKGRSEKVVDSNLTNCRHFQYLVILFWAQVRKGQVDWAKKGGAAARNKGLAFTLVLDKEVRAIMLFPVTMLSFPD